MTKIALHVVSFQSSYVAFMSSTRRDFQRDETVGTEQFHPTAPFQFCLLRNDRECSSERCLSSFHLSCSLFEGGVNTFPPVKVNKILRAPKISLPSVQLP